MDVDAADFSVRVVSEVDGIDAVAPAGGEDWKVKLRSRDGPVEPVAAFALIFWEHFSVFFEEVAEEVVVVIYALFFRFALFPIFKEHVASLHVRDAAHPCGYQFAAKCCKVLFRMWISLLWNREVLSRVRSTEVIMKNTQAYIAAIPVALFIAIESVTILLFGPSTTFWIESAFSLVMLALVVSTLLFGPQKNLKIFGISKILVIGVSFAVQLLLGILGSALKTEALPAIPILSFLLASAATATLFATGASESHASTIENQISSKSQSMQNLELQLRLLLDESPSELRASMTSLLETSSLAAPASCEASAQVEDEISSALRDLSQSIESNDIEGANSKILRMTSLIRQRAALVKASKDS